jgi:hypothetical protein
MFAFITLLHNTKANTSYVASDSLPELPHAGQQGHGAVQIQIPHTIGFKSREEAVANVEKDFAPRVEGMFGKADLALDADMLWDGADSVPSSVVFASKDPDRKVQCGGLGALRVEPV